MGAVLYCIQEIGQAESGTAPLAKDLSPWQAYEMGAAYVKEKTRKALELYNEMLPEFISYGNHCLQQTFAKGLPDFFKWYDVAFEPQNTILTLDYPVLSDNFSHTGIDRIYGYILRINWEQTFLRAFPEDYVKSALHKYNRQYKDMVDNLCEIVLLSVAGHILAAKPLTDFLLEEPDYARIEAVFLENPLSSIQKQLTRAAELFVQEYCQGCQPLSQYLASAIGDISIRLKNAADSHSLHQLL